MLGTSSIDFIQIQFSVNQTDFPELSFSLYATFSQRLRYMLF